MAGLKPEILEQLRCIECKNYLSYLPIRLKTDGTSICGRCRVFEEDAVIRNKPFEQIAATLSFPCQYEKSGCTKMMSLEQVTEHEDDCPYRQIHCPVLPMGSCTWIGSRSALLLHFDKKHQNYVVPHPCSPKPDFEKDSENNLLMMAFGFLFIVQVKLSVSASKLWYCVRYLGKSSFASVFEYHLEMSGNLAESITKINNVCPQERYTIHRENSLEIDLKQLQRFLGDYRNVKFTIEVKIKKMNCLVCKKSITTFPMYMDVQGTYCERCKTENCTEVQETALYGCKYKGCSYFGTAESLPKHEQWFCSFNINPCYLCHVQFRNRSMIEHWKQSHVQSIHYSDTMFHDNLKMKMQYVSELDVFGAIFFCWWQFEPSLLEFKVVSDLPKEKITNFSCQVKLFHYDKTIVLKENYIDQNFDWNTSTKFNRRSYGVMDRYRLEFTIKKTDEEIKSKRKSRGMSQFYFK